MSQQQTQSSAPTRRRPRRLRFIAAVRFTDGRRANFSVDNASQHDEARRMVLEELSDVATVLVAHWRS